MRVAINPLRPLTPTSAQRPLDEELLERLLGVERAYTEFNSRRALRPDETGLEWRAIGERTLAMRDPVRPEIAYYNRVLGLRTDTLDALDEIVAWHAQIGAPTQVDLLPDAMTAEVLEALQARAFRQAGVVSVLLGEPREIVPRMDATGPDGRGIAIEPVTASNVEAFFDHLEATAPSLPPIRAELRALRREHFVAPGFRVYLASLTRQPGEDEDVQALRHVASAALFVHDGVAVLANATTLPGARGRGCQRALLRHRLRVAAELGCDLVMTDVSWGTASHRDIQRIGLQPAWDVVWWLRDETY